MFICTSLTTTSDSIMTGHAVHIVADSKQSDILYSVYWGRGGAQLDDVMGTLKSRDLTF